MEPGQWWSQGSARAQAQRGGARARGQGLAQQGAVHSRGWGPGPRGGAPARAPRVRFQVQGKGQPKAASSQTGGPLQVPGRAQRQGASSQMGGPPWAWGQVQRKVVWSQTGGQPWPRARVRGPRLRWVGSNRRHSVSQPKGASEVAETGRSATLTCSRRKHRRWPGCTSRSLRHRSWGSTCSW